MLESNGVFSMESTMNQNETNDLRNASSEQLASLLDDLLEIEDQSLSQEQGRRSNEPQGRSSAHSEDQRQN